MRTQSIDTHPEVERVLIDMIRKAPMSKRFRSIHSLTQTLFWANMDAWHTSHQEMSEREAAVHVLSYSYGHRLAHLVEETLRCSEGWQLQRFDLIAMLFPLLHTLRAHSIPSYLAGSIASSLHGMQQLAQDCDLVVHVDEQTIPSLKTVLKQVFICDEVALRVAVKQRTAFSLIHLDSLMKIAVIIPKPRAFDEAMLSQVTSYTCTGRLHSRKRSETPCNVL